MVDPNKPVIYFRADGNSQMGLGHIFRSLALADMLKNDFDCRFLIRNPLEALRPKIEAIATLVALPSPSTDLSEAQFIAQHYLTGNEIVVLDGYHFRTAYQEVIKATHCKIVCIDDIYAYHFVADVIINHAGGLTPDVYSKEIYTQCCLGLNYALLQAPFLEAGRQKNYAKQEVNSIFLCLGGADPQNDTLNVLKRIEKVHPTAKLYVILGASYSHMEAFDAFDRASNLSIEKLSNLSAPEMVHYMGRCETMICSPSTISYECLSVGGLLYLYTIADNQASIFKYFTEAGLAFDFLTDYPVVDMQVERAISLQETLLDGQSDKHLLDLFLGLIGS